MSQPKDNGEVLSVRVGRDLKASFAKLAEHEHQTKQQLFQKLLDNYQESKQAKSIVDLMSMHKELEHTFSSLEGKMLDIFDQYNKEIEVMRKKASDYDALEAENKKLLALVLDQQEELRKRKKQLEDQDDMLNYLTVEVERLQNETKGPQMP